MNILLSFILSIALGGAPSVSWKISPETTEKTIVLEAQIPDGAYLHPLGEHYNAVHLEFSQSEAYELVGKPYDSYEKADYKGEVVAVGSYKLCQDIKLLKKKAAVECSVSWQLCQGDDCYAPEEKEFKTELKASATAKESSGKSIWGLILEAILWGFAMLLTPCVFPMVPMTISFFLKGGDDPKKGRFKALMYGLFIVLLYTLPICIIIGLTWLLGGDAVTADIFNWLSTHWLPNLIFFLVFMIFAASFFGAFEIVLPSKWVNGADKNSGKKGLGGVFFLALTLVLVSFSCTGPIVGTVLIESTEGEFWTPMITMLAFSIAFALPFTIFALFPSLLNKLPQSGSWLNSVKVVLGFIEIALGLKFLSTADQVYHWGILNREVYLAIWIVCFTLLGFYLLGKIRFKHDSPVEYISVKRLFLAIIDFAFVIYLIPGMWGAPLSAISGYLPPLESQEFVISSGAVSQSTKTGESEPATVSLPGAQLTLAHGLKAYDNLDDALAEAKKQAKPVFVDITGHGCVNCREMEAKVWSDPRVLSILREDYVLCALYMDDKTSLPEAKWVTTSTGKTLKQVGRANSYIVKERFGVNAQPNYALLSPEGELLVPIRGYDLNVEDYIAFLQSGLKVKSVKKVSIQGARGTLVGEVVKVSDKKAPVAIICHGLTGNRNETFLLAVVDELSKKGISSVRFDFNGHGESEGAFSGMTVSNELEDLEHIYDYVCSLDWVDKSRISLVGHSQGGLVSGIFAGEKGKRKIRSVALLAPAACIQYFAQDGNFFGIDTAKNLPDSIPFWGGRFLGKAYVEDARELKVYERSLRYKGPETIIIGSKDSPDLFKYAKLYSEKSPSISFQELPGLTHCFEEDIHTPARLTAEFLATN